jgi:hypothetical protein
MDPHAGWHATLRAIHEATGWEQGRLVSCAVVLAFWVFAFSGAVASGNPPAWFLACALMSALEPILLGKLYLGRLQHRPRNVLQGYFIGLVFSKKEAAAYRAVNVAVLYSIGI